MSRRFRVCSARWAALFSVTSCFLSGASALAQEAAAGPPPEAFEEVYVFARGERQIGIAAAASEGAVGGADLLVRPLLKVSELLEAVPGMIAAQHSGTGKASQYFLRGFNLDHGSDFTAYIDGMQMNLRSHGHGHGYLDLNGLIAEIIDREDYRKGPYRADGGDFALAGAAYMTTLYHFDDPWVAAEAGSFGWRRLAAGRTFDTGQGELTFVGQWKTYDGPWQQPEDLQHYTGFAKYAELMPFGFLEFTLHGYRGTWKPTEQIPERAIGTAICPDVFCSPDPSATGETSRYIANAHVEGATWNGNVYAQYYDWLMYSNPTFFDSAGNSAQIRQFDNRWIFGLNAEKNFMIEPDWRFRVGTENRFDHIMNVGVHQTADRVFVSSFGAFDVQESSFALYGESEWNPLDPLRLIGGVRGDYYIFDVGARDAAAYSGYADDSIVSAKLAAAYRLTEEIELYANWGQGFHSNDARGVVHPTAPVPGLVRGTGYETGARFQRGAFSLSGTYYWLNLDSELKFVGDTNSVEPSSASRRHGLEIVAFWRPVDWLAIDANYTVSHARFEDSPGTDYIPGAFENAGQLGVSFVQGDWEAAVRWRHLGPYPLIEDNSVRDDGSNIVNARGAYRLGNWEFYAELLNVFDSDDKDIAYYYGAYLPSVDGPFQSPAWDADGGPLGRLSRVVEPRTIRVGAKYLFR